MEFIFTANSARNSDEIVHIIEHGGNGTISKLITPLGEQKRHSVLYSNGVKAITFANMNHYILHVTTHMYPIISNLKLLLENNINISLFFHVPPYCYSIKKKIDTLEQIHQLQMKYQFMCFCPSKEVCKEFFKYGINVYPVQIGIKNFYYEMLRDEKYTTSYDNKFISVCTNGDERYIYIKGIDRFADLMESIGEKENAIILGFKGNYRGIQCERLSMNNFLRVLGNSKAYIQLSRAESYNITAVQAKRLKIPIIVSNVLGHIDCMKNAINRVDNFQDAQKRLLDIGKGIFSDSTIQNNYDDSIGRETIDTFSESILSYFL